MPSLLNCPACKKPLRVTDELLGTQVRCPSCREVFTGTAANGQSHETPPANAQGVTTAPAAPPPPVDPDAIPCPSCATPNSRMLAICHNCGFSLEEAVDDAEEDDDRPWERRRHPGDVRRDCEPHRGTLILVLGIISLVFIGFIGLPFGIAAWIMGQRDIRKIRQGEMDPMGEGTTRAGQVCGIVGTALGTLSTLACLAYLGFWIVLMIFLPFGGPGGRPVTAPVPPPTFNAPPPPPPAPVNPMPDAPDQNPGREGGRGVGVSKMRPGVMFP